MRKLIGSTLLAAGTALSASTLANPYSDMYVFGDSLLDNGSFEGLRFTNRVGPDYQTSDYGPVSPSLVAQGLGITEPAPSRVGGTNYAVGGNRSIETLLSVTADSTYEAPYALTRPELNPTFNSLFYNLEVSGQALDRNAIYIMDGGGNDIGGGLVFDEASAGATAANMVDAASALVNRGAKYVIIANVPDFGLAPAGVPFASFATAQASSVNAQILEQVGSQNIFVFDFFTVLQEVAATPGAFGVPLTPAAISTACFSTSVGTCSGGDPDAKLDGSNPDPDQFFFNDFLHSTTLGQGIAADYFLSVLRAPGEFSLLPEMGMDDMQAQWRSAEPVMRSNRYRTLTPVGQYTVWGGISGNDIQHDTDYNNTGTNKTTQYNLGITYRPSDIWYVGGQLGRGDNNLEFEGNASRYEMDSLNVSLLTGYRVDQWFMEAVVSYSDLDYDQLKRSFDLGTLKRTEIGNTSGDTIGARINGGINLIDAGQPYRLGPVLGYAYVRTEVDGYAEKAGTATALRVDDMDTSTGIASAGIFGDLQLQVCECELYSEITYRYYTDTDPVDPRIGLVTVPGNSIRFPGYARDDGSVRVDVGLAAQFGEQVELNVSGGGSDESNGESYWIGAELSYTF